MKEKVKGRVDIENMSKVKIEALSHFSNKHIAELFSISESTVDRTMYKMKVKHGLLIDPKNKTATIPSVDVKKPFSSNEDDYLSLINNFIITKEGKCDFDGNSDFDDNGQPLREKEPTFLARLIQQYKNMCYENNLKIKLV